MRTRDVFELFGGAAKVARFLGITRGATHQWGEFVPELRQYHLREKRPTIDRDLIRLREAKERRRRRLRVAA